MKLWEKGIQSDRKTEKFTIGKDNELDLYLAPHDILGSLAHAEMLHAVGLLETDELKALRTELIRLYGEAREGKFKIEEGVEDVHSQVELWLTRKLGDTGKKIHTARSRNDQVLLDLKLFMRERIKFIVTATNALFRKLIKQSNRYKDFLLPGYTHLQIAMPSSFGLWFGAYAESLTDDIQIMHAAYRIVNQNPLGSAAGYGTSFPINRKLTTELLGFDSLQYNSVYAQMSRGKTERTVAFALASLAFTLSRLANDVCLFASQNFDFLEIPDEMTTGSSIMPHKKNPDVFELIRAKCNKIQTLPTEIDRIAANLTSGYFRDMQVIKESFIPCFSLIESCIDMASDAIMRLKPKSNILNNELYTNIFSVEEVNQLVLSGMPFREAYQKIAEQIKEGIYKPSRKVIYTHEGSIGNLCNERIADKMKKLMHMFDFEKAEKACKKLLLH